MTEEKKQSLEEWMEEERERLKEGFTYEPKPVSQPSKPAVGDQIAAGLGLGAGVAAGTLGPHPNPVTFEGCKASVIVTALKQELTNDDTRVQVDRSGNAHVATILQSQEPDPHQFFPVLTATMVETADTLTVTLSELNQDASRGAISSVGSTVLDQGKRLLTRRRRRGIGSVLDMADNIKDGIENVVEDIQDLTLPRRVWGIIDRVGEAAERAYLDERRKEQEYQRQREAAEQAWTNCEYCGRVYAEGEGSLTSCPTCGGARGPKPAWL
jgi:rubrerythrin